MKKYSDSRSQGVHGHAGNRVVLQCIASLSGGGAERQVVLLSNELARLGWDVHIAVLDFGQNLSLLETDKVVVHRIKSRSNYDFMIFVRIFHLVWTLKPHAIQTWLPLMDIVGGTTSLLRRIPWLLSERTNAVAHGAGLRSRIRRFLGRHASGIVANSDGGLDYWRTQGANPCLYKTIPNLVPFGNIESSPSLSRASEGFSQDDVLILYVGRLIESKNVASLIKAFSLLKATRNATLLICGDGPLRDVLKALALTLGVLESVRFMGYVGNVYSWMKMVDLIVMPSRYEGMPNAVIEAAAVGCPICLSDIESHRSVLADDAGYFFPYDDIEQMYAAMQGCLESDSSRANSTLKAYESVQRLRPEVVAGEYSDFILGILKDHACSEIDPHA